MTVYDYIRKRWPEQAQRIVEIMCEQDKANAEYALVQLTEHYSTGHLKQLLKGLFVWDGTTEGHAYWKALSEQGERVDGTDVR